MAVYWRDKIGGVANLCKQDVRLVVVGGVFVSEAVLCNFSVRRFKLGRHTEIFVMLAFNLTFD